MKFLTNISLSRLFRVATPALLIVVVCLYVFSFRPENSPELKFFPGSALANHDDLYPVRTDVNGYLYLDREVFVNAVNYFTNNPSPRAIADLIYMGNSNNVTLLLDSTTKFKYKLLSKKSDYKFAEKINQEKDNLLQPYVDIVNGIGQTFSGTPIEIVLYDTRNPLRSILALQNPISGRRIGDTNTNFGIQLIKNFSAIEGKGEGMLKEASFVSYPHVLKDGRKIKSTTVPIFHPPYGLIGFICLNIDISKMTRIHAGEVDIFIDNFKSVTTNHAITEMIKNSKRKN